MPNRASVFAGRSMTNETVCPMCEEPISDTETLDPEYRSLFTIFTLDGPRVTHRECGLREVIGGIGHLIAHEYWCRQKHDPDAGLTYRQSALLVDAYVGIVGVEKAAGNR